MTDSDIWLWSVYAECFYNNHIFNIIHYYMYHLQVYFKIHAWKKEKYAWTQFPSMYILSMLQIYSIKMTRTALCKLTHDRWIYIAYIFNTFYCFRMVSMDNEMHHINIGMSQSWEKQWWKKLQNEVSRLKIGSTAFEADYYLYPVVNTLFLFRKIHWIKVFYSSAQCIQYIIVWGVRDTIGIKLQ